MTSLILLDVRPDPVSVGIGIAIVLFVLALVVVLILGLVLLLVWRKRRNATVAKPLAGDLIATAPASDKH